MMHRGFHLAHEKEHELKKKLSEIHHIKKEGDARNEEMIHYMQNYRKTLLHILDELPTQDLPEGWRRQNGVGQYL